MKQKRKKPLLFFAVLCYNAYMELIIYYLSEIMPILMFSLPLLFIWRFLAIWIMKKRGLKSTAAHEIGAALLGGFCIYILAETVWSQSPCLPSLADINFVPFRVFVYTAEGVANGNYTPLLINFIGNMVVFMPIGFLFGLCYRASNIRRSALMGLSVSLTAEIGQLFSERSTDVDDLWLNTLGALAGYGLCLILQRVMPGFTERFKAYKSEI